MPSLPAPPPRRFTFISSNSSWGGSEELWSAAAAALAEAGHVVSVFKNTLDRAEDRVRRLHELGCTMRDLKRVPLLPNFVSSGLRRVSYPLSFATQLAWLRLGLTVAKQPDLVIVSQGGNHDGLYEALLCQRMRLPYVLILQKASDLYWPIDSRRVPMRTVFSDARACYFVSEHNLRLTEEQLGIGLPRASVVRNPFLVPWEPRHDWPGEEHGVRLACIGRLNPMEKGQDILLRVLARDKWRQRPLRVTFYGEGLQRQGLEGMASKLGLTSVVFGGFVRDIAAIWSEHQGLILPSRCEGLPLVLVEAMLSGRVPIVTNVAGSGEMVHDNTTGFLAAAPTEDALDEAMERAWQRREEWPAIGATAAVSIRTLVPADPAAVLAGKLLELCSGVRS